MQIAVRSYLAAGTAVLSTVALTIGVPPTADTPTPASFRAVQLSAMTDAEALTPAFRQAGGATLSLGTAAILLFRGFVVDRLPHRITFSPT